MHLDSSIYLRTFLAALLFAHLCPERAKSYIDSSPTLGSLVYAAETITIVQVEKVNVDKQVVIFRATATLKGKAAGGQFKQRLVDERHPHVARALVHWAEANRRAICFTHGRTQLMYTGSVWYESVAGPDGWWLMTRSRPELALAYVGTVEKLRQAVVAIAAKKTAVITAVRHRDRQGFEAYGQTAAQQNLMRGPPPPLWRLKAALDMPSVTISLIERPNDNPWVVGPGAGRAEDLPPLIAALQDPQMPVRADAADELRLFGKEARSAVPALKAALADPEAVVGIRAAAALGWIDPGNADAVTRLITLATAAQGPRREAIEALGDLGAAARKAVPALRGLLTDRDKRVRAAAAESLGLIGPDAVSGVSDLLPLLDDKEIGPLAADALGRIGPTARGAIPHLLAALRRNPVEANWACAVALIRIEPAAAEPAIPVLINALESPDERTRWDARWCFTALGPTTEKAVPKLLPLLTHADDHVRWAATRVLGILENRLQQHVPRFIELAGSELRADRLRAFYLLRSAGPVATAAIPILEKELQNPDLEVQTAAREALRAIRRK